MKRLKLFVPLDGPQFHRSTYAFQLELVASESGNDLEVHMLDHPSYEGPAWAFSTLAQKSRTSNHIFLNVVKLAMAVNPTPFVLTMGLEQLYKHEPERVELIPLPPNLRGQIDTIVCDHSARFKEMIAFGHYGDDYILFSSGTKGDEEEYIDTGHKGLLECLDCTIPPVLGGGLKGTHAFPRHLVDKAREKLRSKCHSLPLLNLATANVALFWNENECKAEDVAHWMKHRNYPSIVVTFMIELDVLILDTLQILSPS